MSRKFISENWKVHKVIPNFHCLGGLDEWEDFILIWMENFDSSDNNVWEHIHRVNRMIDSTLVQTIIKDIYSPEVGDPSSWVDDIRTINTDNIIFEKLESLKIGKTISRLDCRKSFNKVIPADIDILSFPERGFFEIQKHRG